MYVPSHFAEDRADVVVEMLRAAGLGHLVVATDDGLDSTPVPFVVDDEIASVRMHLARPNHIWRAAPSDALLIVAVADAYVSPSWYPSKAEHGKVVPTWNYEVVHLHGRLICHDDPDWLTRQIADLTDANESAMPSPWSVDDAPDEYIATMRRGIIGVELAVSRIEAKRKLSQNRDATDRAGARAGLAARRAVDDRIVAGIRVD